MKDFEIVSVIYPQKNYKILLLGDLLKKEDTKKRGPQIRDLPLFINSILVGSLPLAQQETACILQLWKFLGTEKNQLPPFPYIIQNKNNTDFQFLETVGEIICVNLPTENN